jgi:hypothetical protein
MTRPTHSFAAYRRLMQMSRYQVFVFVEGSDNDPYFYGKICDPVFVSEGVSYQLSGAHELLGTTGGKKLLLSFFVYLKQSGSLIDDFKGKRTTCIFFLDKDIDDLARSQRRSPHVVYTRFYDVENHIYAAGKLLEGAAAAASMNPADLQALLSDPAKWRASAALRWKEWVKLCIFSQRRKIRCGCNFGVPYSPINTPLNGPLDSISHSQRLAALQSQSGLTSRQFRRSFGTISQLVDAIYEGGEYNRVFKGKWYKTILEADIKHMAPGRRYDSNGLVARLTSAIAVTIDFNGSWADHFRTPLCNLIALMRS